ncbi:MAG TPA: DsbA family protein [Pilimelia sp.]|nr:DsbA family protein [Pilimelia sp.]
MKRPPRLYFSFRSPYSWLTLTRLLADIPDLFARVELLPYWDPDPGTDAALRERGAEFHYVQMSKAKHLYLLQDTKRLTQRMGLRMAWPIDVDPWWEVPHLAWLLARDHGRAAEFYAAVVRARWERGENICQAGVVADLAASVGVDADAVAGAATDPRLRSEGVQCLVQAYDDDVFGIPYLRVGRHRYWGFDRAGDMVDALRPGDAVPPAPEQRRAGELVPVGRSYDTDTAGGCG